MSLNTCKKARIAPTPSGYLHAGNIFSFTLTVALARRTGASVLLRIDDMDRDRVSGEYVRDIFETLRFLKIPWDEGPADVVEFQREYSQVLRMGLYREALESLRGRGAVFACRCSRSDLRGGVYPGTCRELGLSLDDPGVSWRLRTTDCGVLHLRNLSGGDVSGMLPGGDVSAALPAEMQDFVVRKKDGFPAYQLTSLVDDVHFGVDLIVRGQDLWPSTLAQHCLSFCLPGADAFREASFYHHPLLVGDGGEKLSKSAGASSIQYMRRQGMDAVAVYTHIARLLGNDAEVHGWEELAALVLG
jgi:glutamyl-tRNA synthetase